MAARPSLKVSEERYLAEMTALSPAVEFVNGEVFEKPLTKRDHVDVARALNRAFLPYEASSGGYWAWETTTSLSVGADRRYRVPDLAYWAPGKPVGATVFLPPTLAIEIASQGQSRQDLRAKCREYRARGVDVCWLIDPSSRTVEVFEGESDEGNLPPAGILESAALPGFSLEVAALWGDA